MFKKGSKLYSIFKMKCPQCQEGEFFVSHPYDLSKVGDIHQECSHCHLKYEKEPGFYYGAMYVSYALGVALFVTLWVSMKLFFPKTSLTWQLVIIFITFIVIAPYFYALSKIIWANLFIRYDEKKR